MPWDSVDKPRDEDLTDRRRRQRRLKGHRRLVGPGRRLWDKILTKPGGGSYKIW